MKLFPVAFIAAFLAFHSAAEEIPLQRSSHPRGFIEGGAVPPIVRAQAPASMSGSGERSQTLNTGAPSGGQTSQSSSAGGINIIGNIRIDARVQGASAAAAGEKNTSSNRIGVIGGK